MIFFRLYFRNFRTLGPIGPIGPVFCFWFGFSLTWFEALWSPFQISIGILLASGAEEKLPEEKKDQEIGPEIGVVTEVPEIAVENTGQLKGRLSLFHCWSAVMCVNQSCHVASFLSVNVSVNLFEFIDWLLNWESREWVIDDWIILEIWNCHKS